MIIYNAKLFQFFTECRKFYIVVEGRHVTVSGSTACMYGILYAPNVVGITIRNSGTTGRLVVEGQLAAGPGGVSVTGNPVSIQLNPDYVDVFNDFAGDSVDVAMVSGSWRAF